MREFLESAIKPWKSRSAAQAPSLLHGELLDRFPIQDLLSDAEAMGDLGFWKYLIAEETVLWTPGVFRIHGLEPGMPIAVDNALAFYPPHHRPMLEAAMDRTKNTGEPYDLEIDLTNARGQRKRVRTIGKAARTNGRITALHGLCQDLTERRAMESHLRSATLQDAASKLPNRRHLHQFFSDLGYEKGWSGTRYALALITCHDGRANAAQTSLSDQTIAAIAGSLRADWLRCSFAARMGAREFALLIRAPELLDALVPTGERLLKELRDALIAQQPGTSLAPAIGIACVEEEACTLSQVLSTADSVLYMAKRGDRGQCVIAQDGDLFLDAA